LELGDPDLVHPFGFEEADILLTQNVTFGEELLAPLPEDRTAKNSAGGFFDIDGLSLHYSYCLTDRRRESTFELYC